MSVIAAAGITAAASLLGGAASASASRKESARNREFQERMSNTAYQRAADDMEAAGLNRILALGSPATTPGGSVAQIPDYGANLVGGIQAGTGIASSAQDISQSQAQQAKILQETKNLSEKEKQLVQQSKLWQTIGPILTQGAKDFNDLLQILKQEAPGIAQAIKESSTAAIKGTAQAVSNYYNITVQEVSDLFTELDEAFD